MTFTYHLFVLAEYFNSDWLKINRAALKLALLDFSLYNTHFKYKHKRTSISSQIGVTGARLTLLP